MEELIGYNEYKLRLNNLIEKHGGIKDREYDPTDEISSITRYICNDGYVISLTRVLVTKELKLYDVDLKVKIERTFRMFEIKMTSEVRGENATAVCYKYWNALNL